MGKAIGIDFSLHNCRVAALREKQPFIIENINGNRLTPVVVGVSEDGEWLVGEEAKAQAVLYPTHTIFEIRRFLGRGFGDKDIQADIKRVPYKVTEAQNGEVAIWLDGNPHSPVELSAFILEALKQEAEEQLGQISQAIFTVPAHFDPQQQDAVCAAGQQAGLEVMTLVLEPVAAALAYGFTPQSGKGKTLLVYDLGESTFNATVLRIAGDQFTILAQIDDRTLGGNNFNQQIINHIIQHIQHNHTVNLRNNRVALHKLKQAAEAAKMTLSGRRKTARITIPAIAQDEEGGWINVQLSLSRPEYEAMIRPDVKRTIELAHQAIQNANCLPEAIDHILPVGGATLTPLVTESLRADFGDEKLLQGVNPTECVALGAAIATADPLLAKASIAPPPKKQKPEAKAKPGTAKYRGPIPAAVSLLMATCFIKAGRLDKAERLLQDMPVSQHKSSLRYELGMAYAEQGQLDEALGQFRTCLQEQPDESRVRQAAVDVLCLTAGQCAGQNDWDGAAGALNQALTLNPKDTRLRQYLTAVNEALPLRYLAKGNREKAAQLWEEARQAAPTNYRLAHQLAILYHRWAIELEQEGHTRAADYRWPKAIANWVLLIKADPFWEEWTARREAIYGQSISTDDITTLRQKELYNQLEQIHRDFQTQNSKRADKHKEYRLLLQMELNTATALEATAKLLQQQGEPVPVPVYAGPLMLEQLGLRDTAERMAALAKQLNPKAKAPQTLATYLSPLGRMYLLIEERQTDQAIRELKEMVKQEPQNNEARRLLVLAFMEAGNVLAASDTKKAVAAWAEGLAYEPDNTELTELIAKNCIEQATKLQKNDADAAIKLLNLGLAHVPNHRRLKEELAASLNRRGVQYSKRGMWDKASADLEQALRYAPHNRQYQQNLAAVYNRTGAELANKAIELMKQGRMADAEPLLNKGIRLLEEAVQYAPRELSYKQNLANAREAKQHLLSPPKPKRLSLGDMLMEALLSDPKARQKVASDLNTKGVQLANEAIRLANQGQAGRAERQLTQAIAMLEKAVKYVPQNATFRQNLADAREALRLVRAGPAGKSAKPRGPEALMDALLHVLVADPAACNELGLKLVKEAAQLAPRNRQAACAKLKEAENIFEMGLQYTPNDTSLKNNLIQVRTLKRMIGC